MEKYLELIFISILAITQSTYVKFPFTKFTNTSDWTEQNIFTKLQSNMISINLNFKGVGTKTYKFNLDNNIYYSYIANPESTYEIDSPFITKFACDSNLNCQISNLTEVSLNDDDVDKIDKARTNVSLNSDNLYLSKNDLNLQVDLTTLTFVYPRYVKKTSLLYANSGKIGLGFASENQEIFDGNNFINGLKSQNYITYKCFFLEYNTKTDGNLIIGTYPYEYDNKKYPKSNFNTTHLYERENKPQFKTWSFSLNRIYYGNKKFPDSSFKIKTAYLKISFGMIEAPKSVGDYLYSNFFKARIDNGKCSNIEEGDYLYYKCKKDFGIDDMQNIYLVNDMTKTTFELRPKDLFYEFNNTMYYLIRFYNKESDGQVENWILGEPFISNYLIAFNMDNNGELLVNETDFVEPGEPAKPKKANFWDYIVFTAICVVIVGILIYTIITTCKSSNDEEDEGKEEGKEDENDPTTKELIPQDITKEENENDSNTKKLIPQETPIKEEEIKKEN